MASKYDAARDRRKNSEERINQIIASYPSPSSAPSTPQGSKYANVRNRTELPASDLPNSVLPSFQQQIGNINNLVPGFQEAAKPDIVKPQPVPTTLPTFQQQVGNIKNVVGTGAQDRQQRAQDSLLTNIGQAGGKFIGDLLRPITDLLPKPNENSIVGSIPERGSLISQIGDAAQRTQIPYVTDNSTVPNFIRGVGDTASLGLSTYLDRMSGQGERADEATRSTAGNVGQFVGSLVLPAGKVKAGAGALKNIGNAAAAGGLLSGLGELGEQLTNRNDQTYGQRIGDIAIGAALGGAGGALGHGVTATFGKLLKRNNIPDETIQEILALPAPRERGNLNTAATDDVIIPEYQFALPAPKVAEPTTARIARQSNPFREQFENLIRTAQRLQDEGRFTPGREDLELENLWSQMAGREGVSLDELIQRAYPTRPDRVSPDLVQRARSNQYAREVAGAPLPVRTLDERMQPQGVLGNAAAPQQAPARAPGVPIGESEIRVNSGSLNGPRARVDITDEANAIPSQVQPESIPVDEAPAMKGNWFTSLFGNRGVGIAAGRSRSGRNQATTEGQIVDNPLRRDTKGFKNQVAHISRTIENDYADFTKSLQHVGPDIYDIAQDARRANNLANTSVFDKFVDTEGNIIGQSLKDVGNKVARGEANAFRDYLVLRHAQTRVARGENVFDPKLQMNDVDKIKARLEVLNKRYPEFAAIAREWDQYNGNLRNLWEKEGLISPEQNAAMKAANPFYASNRRQFSTSEKYANPFTKSGSAFSGQKAPIKEVSPTGSFRKIVDPFRTAIEQTGATYNAILRNRVIQNIYQKVKADPEHFKGLVEIVPEEQAVSQKNLDEINSILQTDDIEGLAEKLNDEFLQLKKGGQKAGKNDNIVTALIDGNPVKLKVENPELFKSLVGLGPEESNAVLDFFGALSNATKYGATGALAPLFAAKGLTTDIAQSLIQSKQPLWHVWDLLHATLSSFANQLPRKTKGIQNIRALAQDFQRTGGEYSAALKGDRELNNAVGDVLRDPFLSRKGAYRLGKKAFTAPFRTLNAISDIAENVNRIAAYKGALRRQGGARTQESIRNAMREAQEITTNFSRRGAKSQAIEKFIPYNNAAIQGVRRFGRQLKEHPIRSAALITGAIIMPKVYEYAKFGEDPDYQKLPARERYRNIFIGKNADGTFVKLPMPPEYNAIGAFVNDLLQAYKDGDPVNWRESSDAIVNAYTPPWLSGGLQGVTQGGGAEQSIWGALNSTSIAAPVAVAANQSFTGAPIVSQRLSSNSPGQQYDERTSELAKTIGQKIGLAPLKVDYLLRAYGGDPARLVLPLFSDVGAGTPKNTLLKNFIADPVFTNNLSTNFYDMKEKITQAEADNRTNGVPFPSWYDEGVAKTITTSKKGGLSKRLSELSTQKREVQGNKNLTAKEKANQLRDIQSQINNLYLDSITIMRQGGVPGGR